MTARPEQSSRSSLAEIHSKSRLLQAVILIAFFGLYYASTRLAPASPGTLGSVTAVGFLLLGATLTSELTEGIKIPHLTGYILAGAVAGPHVLNLVEHKTVENLSPVNALALALIAVAGGAELDLPALRAGAKSLLWATLTQSTFVLLVVAAGFVALHHFMSFTVGLSTSALIAIALLWGTLAVSRSPAATLGILAQTKAKGPLTTSTLAMVMTSDVVVLLLMAFVMTVARPLVDPSISFSLSSFGDLGHSILGSIAIGTTLGLLLVLYIKVVGRGLIVVLLALGFGASEILDYLGFEPLLSFLVAGFVVRNLSGQGHKLLKAIEETGSIVYVVFFAIAGAHLDLPLVKALLPVAMALCALRVAATYAAARFASRLAQDPPVIKSYGWSGLVSQAGLTLGLSAIVEHTFPAFGAPFRSLVLATVALNEVAGPILFKGALDRNGESQVHA